MDSPAGAHPPMICLVRHGETELSAARCFNGVIDTELTREGEQQAEKLAVILSHTRWETVLCSPAHRARRTAELAGFPSVRIHPSLLECDFGDYEGKTTAQIRAERPDWDFWRHGCPHGESPEDVATRLDPLIHELRAVNVPVLLFSHSHLLRILTASWLELPATGGAMFEYAPAHLSILATHRGRPVVRLWNDGSHLWSAWGWPTTPQDAARRAGGEGSVP